jgi:hypothetical protein
MIMICLESQDSCLKNDLAACDEINNLSTLFRDVSLRLLKQVSGRGPIRRGVCLLLKTLGIMGTW